MKKGEIPIGLGMALAQNPEAMKQFVMMSDAEQQQIIAGIHAVHSKQEMYRYVEEKLSHKTSDQ